MPRWCRARLTQERRQRRPGLRSSRTTARAAPTSRRRRNSIVDSSRTRSMRTRRDRTPRFTLHHQGVHRRPRGRSGGSTSASMASRCPARTRSIGITRLVRGHGNSKKSNVNQPIFASMAASMSAAHNGTSSPAPGVICCPRRRDPAVSPHWHSRSGATGTKSSEVRDSNGRHTNSTGEEKVTDVPCGGRRYRLLHHHDLPSRRARARRRPRASMRSPSRGAGIRHEQTTAPFETKDAGGEERWPASAVRRRSSSISTCVRTGGKVQFR